MIPEEVWPKFKIPEKNREELKLGLKFDSDKLDWYPMPLEILEPLVDVYRAGEKKYETFNCLQHFDNGARRFYSGMMRHVVASQINPLAIDEETGCYHLAQVAFNALHRLRCAIQERNTKCQKTQG